MMKIFRKLVAKIKHVGTPQNPPKPSEPNQSARKDEDDMKSAMREKAREYADEKYEQWLRPKEHILKILYNMFLVLAFAGHTVVYIADKSPLITFESLGYYLTCSYGIFLTSTAGKNAVQGRLEQNAKAIRSAAYREKMDEYEDLDKHVQSMRKKRNSKRKM